MIEDNHKAQRALPGITHTLPSRLTKEQTSKAARIIIDMLCGRISATQAQSRLVQL